ncbi:MAG: MogA/MoaB family molybdenum cofactor biosynthesis protein [Desulfovibrionaceae bacterium]|nr:MogA/MoaB family molybdenum cofactor biosynthesis protein [Desulfovibrionaceae bacterium]MBF0512979.1 MogA/MoaB family molybdenum cofactor biosynthesis protein [Desulfovibrionaceae bacterium]
MSVMAQTVILTYPAGAAVVSGQRLVLSSVELPGVGEPLILAVGGLPRLRAGTLLRPDKDVPRLRIAGGAYFPRGGREPAARVYFAEALFSGFLAGGASAFTIVRQGFSLAWITLSDKGFAGLRGDESGPLIARIASQYLPIGHAQGFLLPDDPLALRALLTDLALTQGYDLIVTTGGTGLAPSDKTPEATLAVIDSRLGGFETAMAAASLKITPMAAISRAVCGALGQSVIVNLPGSPKAVAENFAAIGGALEHALRKLQGDPADCARIESNVPGAS